jgi:hypothetical protein
MNKRGLSAVVTTLIIILLVIVAAGIIWVVVKAFIDRGSGDIELEQFNLDIQIKHAYLEDNLVKVGITRNKGAGDLTGVKFIFSDGSNSDGVERASSLDEFDTLSFVFDADDGVDIDNVIEVSVAPMYITSGKEKLGGVTDTADILNAVPGNIGAGVGGCGDGSCSGGETPETCSADCGDPDGGEADPADCGNEDIDTGETCDGENFNGEDCVSLDLGFVGGTLACNDDCLSFDTGGCDGETPSSCDGEWEKNGDPEDQGVECDGADPLPDHCIACVCEAGFGPDFVADDGTCIIDDPVSSGFIYSVWPEGAAKYFDSEQLPLDTTDYTTYFVNFRNSNENSCFQITWAEYMELNGRTYLRLAFIADIIGGEVEEYDVWEAANCGL